jgi:hypothetical protein
MGAEQVVWGSINLALDGDWTLLGLMGKSKSPPRKKR